MKNVILTGLLTVVLGSTIHAQVYEGVATHFEALGTPYGGCGVPGEQLEAEHYVALNVFNTPGIYQSYTRPLQGDDLDLMGEFKNGSNCGRWVRVTIGPDCKGANDGAQNQPFCREGEGWVDDEYSGATLDMIVTDACGDGNAWCRDSRYHLDLSTHSLNQFRKDGQPVLDMYPLHWNNRKVFWEYIEAPAYSGDIKIHFMQGAQYYWPAIMIDHLKNGISRVEQKVGDQWIEADRNSDMGQSFILKDLTQPYLIRAYDASGNLINQGREYLFQLPASCGSACSDPVNEVEFEVNNPVVNSIGKGTVGLNKIHSENGILEFTFSDYRERKIVVVDLMGAQLAKISVQSDKAVVPLATSGQFVLIGIMTAQSLRWEKVYLE